MAFCLICGELTDYRCADCAAGVYFCEKHRKDFSRCPKCGSSNFKEEIMEVRKKTETVS